MRVHAGRYSPHPEVLAEGEPRRTLAAAAGHSSLHAPHRHHAAHALGGALRVAPEAGAVGAAEELGEVKGGAGALLAARHGEMVLMTVEIGHEHDAGLVEAGRRPEDVAR